MVRGTDPRKAGTSDRTRTTRGTDVAGADRTRTAGGAVVGRAAAVVALAVLGLHALAATDHLHSPATAGLLLLMSVGCAVCSVRCLRRPCRHELTALLIMSCVMVVVHVALLLAPAGAGGHHHGAALTAAPDPAASGMALSMLGLAAAELLVAALCAAALRRVTATSPPRRPHRGR